MSCNYYFSMVATEILFCSSLKFLYTVAKLGERKLNIIPEVPVWSRDLPLWVTFSDVSGGEDGNPAWPALRRDLG